ncbi:MULTISPECIES: hypothetical protein [Acinetobacter]|uniref:hypothetical protein n=1 Tax=Acinetobacter TaxID=469 RepID=UPI0008F46C99|nr:MULTISPECIES: hypothetical protein [Acinetobacter]OIJ29364.1 hypothetical protein BK820_14870 [Acinetobacter sp. LCT-H3]
MTFQFIFENFKALSNGTDAFKQLKALCEQSISNDNNNLDSSALFLIYGFAKNYVLLYEDQEITPEFAKKAKNQLIDYMSELNTALISQDSNLILNTLNNISKKYFKSSKIF